MILETHGPAAVFGLAAPERLQIADGAGKIWYGCDQEWFNTHWQRLAGCGPCVASNILLYLNRKKSIVLPFEIQNKVDFVRLMEIAWQYVTPTVRGLNTPELMCSGLEELSKAHGFKLECRSLGVPRSKKGRPPLSQMADFIAEGLSKDCPVAFLNLSNGAVQNLDQWHWVTIVSLEKGRSGHGLSAGAYDGAAELTVDLGLWYETTTLGGGFVYFTADAGGS